MIFARPRLATLVAIIVLLSLIIPLADLPSATDTAQASPLPARSFFGMNLYVTGLERPKDEKLAMLSAARDLGVRWSREEMSWANLEPDRKGIYNWSAYDPWINEQRAANIDIVGSIQ